MRAFLALLMIATSIYAAHAIGLGREGRGFGKLGAMDKKASGSGPTNFLLANTGSALLVNTGSKFLVQ